MLQRRQLWENPAMTKREKTAMSLKLELFVGDMEKSRDFYTRVLDFEIERQEPNGYTALRNGRAQLALNVRSNPGGDHPIRAEGHERPGRGVEIVLEVGDVEASCARVQAAGWPLSGPLKKQSWGQVDFRVGDPDGYNLRISSPG